MTIKDFARLCGCNPKTLRYYDQIDLLKPVRVDKFSGYRHYDEKQALTFVKIKNLQSAGFSIEEIKNLIDKGNADICRAFEEKIREQEHRLQKIRDIHESYQSEMNRMNDKIREIRDHIEQAMANYDPGEEFGINTEYYENIRKTVCGFFEGVISESNGGSVEFHDEGDDDYTEEEEYLNFLNNPEYEVTYETHGWQHVKDIAEELIAYTSDDEEAILVKTVNDSSGTAYAVTLVGMILDGRERKQRNLGVNITKSNDGINHIWILRKKP